MTNRRCDVEFAVVWSDNEDLAVGNLVWTRDDADPDGPLVLRPVTRVFTSTAYDLQAVTVAGADGGTETYHVTDGHPFYVDGRGWTEAAALRPGFELVSADGARYTVAANADDPRPSGVTVYNLEVADGHTYFVADGAGSDAYLWAHNTGTCDLANLPASVYQSRIGDPKFNRIPATLKDFNPRIYKVSAGELSAIKIARKHGLDPQQLAAVKSLANADLVKFRLADPISSLGIRNGLKLTGGHHRTHEIIERVRGGSMDPKTLIEIMVHD